MDKQREKHEERIAKIDAAVAVVMDLPSESPYGLTQEYDRSLYDSPTAKRKFHDDAFKGKKTIKSKDGTLLHKSSKAARNKYKSKASQHQAQVDHKDPLKNAHQRHKKNPFLKDADFKKALNRKSNLQELSARENARKGAKSEIKMAFDPDTDQSMGERVQRLAGGTWAQAETDILLTGTAAQNIGAEVINGAKDALAASAIPLVIRSTQDLIQVASGKMSFEEAIDDVGKLGLSIAATGGSTRVASFALATALKNTGIEPLQKFAQVNQIGTILVVGSIIARATGKYLSCEVDAEGFFDEIGKDGLSLVSGMVASETVKHLLVGSATAGIVTVAPVLAAMVASAACSEIYSQAKKLREERKDNAAIRKIAEQASQSIRQQQEELAQLLERDHQQWVQDMTRIFNGIAEGLTNNNIQQTNQNLRCLMRTLHSKEIVLYESGEQAIDDLVAIRQGKRRLPLFQIGGQS